MVIIETNLGNIHVELDAEKAPISVENFLAYVDDEYFDGTIFHRVIPNFMIQGGGMDENMQQKATRDPIKNEADNRSEEHTSELQSRETISYAVFCLKKKKKKKRKTQKTTKKASHRQPSRNTPRNQMQ